ncbi:MAG: hypothetical protein ACI85O_001880 [Saprospiraceae bacterium]|jgi:hypothetical protein
MKNRIKIFLLACFCLAFSNLITAQNLCDTDADFLTPEADLTESYTELCGNNVTSNIIVNEGQEVVYRNKTSLLLTDGFEVKAGGIMETAYCDVHVSSNNIVQLSQNIHITPNPTSSNAVVEIDLDAAANLQLSLINTFGQVVKKIGGSQQYDIGINTFTIEMSELPAGIYIVQVTDGKRISSRRIVKQ